MLETRQSGEKQHKRLKSIPTYELIIIKTVLIGKCCQKWKKKLWMTEFDLGGYVKFIKTTLVKAMEWQPWNDLLSHLKLT